MRPDSSGLAMPELDALIDRFAGTRSLVLGDMVADEYLIGRPARISREAPVLILHYTTSFVRPGGATNTAHNLSRLGAAAAVAGVIGDDEMGRKLRATLDEEGIDTSCLLVDGDRPTSTLTRILGKGTQEVQQQIVRIDRIDSSAMPAGLRDRMIENVRRLIGSVDALVISDHANGVISPELLEACLPKFVERGVTTVVDSHGDLFRFKGVTAATPNQPEAVATVGATVTSEEDLDRVGEQLVTGMKTRGVLITRGSEGVALYEAGRTPYKLPVSTSSELEVVDPTGAGDTVAAVFTLALAAGATMRTAAYLADVAGGAVVRRVGAATLSPSELRAALRETHLLPPGD